MKALVAVSCAICSQTTHAILLIAFKCPELFKGSGQHSRIDCSNGLSVCLLLHVPDTIQKYDIILLYNIIDIDVIIDYIYDIIFYYSKELHLFPLQSCLDV